MPAVRAVACAKWVCKSKDKLLKSKKCLYVIYIVRFAILFIVVTLQMLIDCGGRFMVEFCFLFFDLTF